MAQLKQGELSSGVSIGIGAALISWSCCISAIVLAFLGLSAASAFFAKIQMEYHWWLVGAAFIFFDIAVYYFIKQYHGACNLKTIRNNWSTVAFVILVALAMYYILDAVLPSLVELSGVPMGGM